jgi:hypothetical protein
VILSLMYLGKNNIQTSSILYHDIYIAVICDIFVRSIYSVFMKIKFKADIGLQLQHVPLWLKKFNIFCTKLPHTKDGRI